MKPLYSKYTAGRPLPEVIYAELVDLLFTAIFPTCSIGLAATCVSVMVWSRSSDPLIALLTAAIVACASGRVLLLFAYRRAGQRKLAASEARLWERRYLVGAALFGSLIGALGLRGVTTGGPLVSMLITALIFGYGAGLITRVAVRPAICITSLATASVPTIMGFALNAYRTTSSTDSEVYLTQAVLLTLFAVAGVETLSYGYRLTVQQLLAKRHLSTLAEHDPLTGLSNRLHLQTQFEAAADHLAPDGLLALHCLDLNRFKAVNDTHGHPMGDALLQAVAARLSRTLQSGDVAARLGGDEFVVLQSGLHSSDEARLLAQRIARVLSAPYSLKGRELRVGASIGVTVALRQHANLENMIAHADAALYQAKRDQKGGVVFWSDDSPPEREAATA